MVCGGRPLLPEIFGQPAPVEAKSPILNRPMYMLHKAQRYIAKKTSACSYSRQDRNCLVQKTSSHRLYWIARRILPFQSPNYNVYVAHRSKRPTRSEPFNAIAYASGGARVSSGRVSTRWLALATHPLSRRDVRSRVIEREVSPCDHSES